LRSLVDVLNDLRDSGLLKEELERPLPRDYAPTKIIKKAESEGKAVVFRVEGSPLVCVANLVGSRRMLYRYLKVSSDQEAYNEILSSLSRASEEKLIEEGRFDDFFEVANFSYEELPSIKFYPNDGGRYITSSVVVAKTPELPSYNASIHRLMHVPGKGFAIRLVPRHLYNIYRKNLENGKETPVAISIGVSPLYLLSAAISPPYGYFEMKIYASLVGGASYVKTPLYGLPVDPYASLVVEGQITKEFVKEGPFVDLLETYDRVRDQPLIKVDKIYINKKSNLFHVILPGGREHKVLMGFPREASIWDAVRKVVPFVKGVRLTEGGGGWLHAVISIRKNSDGDGKSAIMAAFAAHPSLKHVVVVDEDIDPEKLEDVEWAIATRFQASRGLVVINNARGSSLDPSAEDGLTAKVGIDATYPLKEKVRFMRPVLP